MALPSPLTSVAAVVGADGITIPTYAATLEYFQTKYRGIFGGDSYIEPDSQDGQLMAEFAKAVYDTNMAVVAAYNNYSPATSQGEGLSAQVKINGIRRLSPSHSTVDVTIVGRAGTIITGGIVADVNGAHQWNLPATVTIPPGGEITATATATDEGAIQAPAATITKIVTPTLGWQSVTNGVDASPGAPVESDAALRRRQAYSVSLPAQTPMNGIRGAVANVFGVSESVVYENSSSDFDSNGIPPHSIAAVVLGGDATEIATAIRQRKTPGANTYGDVSVSFTNPVGIPETISFFVPSQVNIAVAITITALAGYTATIGTSIKQAVADYINALGIGVDVQIARLFLPAQLFGGVNSDTFQLESVAAAIIPAVPGAADVVVAFNSIADCATADIALTVL